MLYPLSYEGAAAQVICTSYLREIVPAPRSLTAPNAHVNIRALLGVPIEECSCVATMH